jgi:hypothetical protein
MAEVIAWLCVVVGAPDTGAGDLAEDWLQDRQAAIDDAQPGLEDAPVGDLTEFVGEILCGILRGSATKISEAND